MRTWLRVLSPAILVAFALSFASCGGGGSAPEKSAGFQPPPAAPPRPKVRLQLNWFPEPEFGGIYAARERGFFEKAGVDVELLQGGADVPAPQLVASGRAEMGVLAAEQVLTVRAQGGRLKAVFACFQTSPRVIVVKADSPHATIESLWRSQSTVLAQDGLTFIQWLNRTYPGGKLSFVPYAGSAAPLVAGTVDAMQAFATAEPVQLELDGVPTRSFLVADSGYAPYDVVICANEEYLAREGETVRKVASALREGWASYLADPGPINEAMAALNRDMKPEVMAKSAALLPAFVESDATRASGPGVMEAARWESLARQLVDLGVLETMPDVASAWVDVFATTTAAPN